MKNKSILGAILFFYLPRVLAIDKWLKMLATYQLPLLPPIKDWMTFNFIPSITELYVYIIIAKYNKRGG